MDQISSQELFSPVKTFQRLNVKVRKEGQRIVKQESEISIITLWSKIKKQDLKIGEYFS